MLEELRAIESAKKRLTLEAEEYVRKNAVSKAALDVIIALDIPIITIEDIKKIIAEDKKIPEKEESDVEVKRNPKFKPIAKEYSANIKINADTDVSGQSRCMGKIDDFVAYFRDRFRKESAILRSRSSILPTLRTDQLEQNNSLDARIIVMVTDKRITTKGNLFLEVEDEQGQAKVVISFKERKFTEYCKIVRDDVVIIEGRNGTNFFIGKEIIWPDIPIIRQKPKVENDLAVVYLSDLHLGSKYFLEREFKRFLKWIRGEYDNTELASKVKYIVVAGDIADGIGVYPTQENELTITDIYKQYEEFDKIVEALPDYIEVIVGPGNHDAVRRGEPQPIIPKELIKTDVKKIGSPSTLEIEGLKHLVYHGTSLDSVIANISGLSYTKPEGPMLEILKRRHLSPIYGENLIIPELKDYLVIKEEPDVLHMGHIHKNAYMNYRGTAIINSGTFQSRTDFQIRMGHIPTPGIVPVMELKTGVMTHLKFSEESI